MNDRIALAATLNANVCTSLSSRYFTSAVPSWRSRYHLVCVTGMAPRERETRPACRWHRSHQPPRPGRESGAAMAVSTATPESETVATCNFLGICIRIFTFVCARPVRSRAPLGQGVSSRIDLFPRICRDCAGYGGYAGPDRVAFSACIARRIPAITGAQPAIWRLPKHSRKVNARVFRQAGFCRSVAPSASSGGSAIAARLAEPRALRPQMECLVFAAQTLSKAIKVATQSGRIPAPCTLEDFSAAVLGKSRNERGRPVPNLKRRSR